MNRKEFDEAVKGSFTTEMGTFGTRSGDEKKFGEYICKHWPELLDAYIPNFNKRALGTPTLTINVICYAVEDLPPMEYLDFLDEVLDMAESGQFKSEHRSLLLIGRNKKSSFLEVNWEHPRVQTILKRAIKLLSDDKVAMAAFEAVAAGKLADNYRNGISDGAPEPETLPGIRLQRPWSSLIRKYEWLTGKKVPPDPKYDPRPDRRGQTATGNPKERITAVLWPWFALGSIPIGIVFFLMKKRRVPKSRLS